MMKTARVFLPLLNLCFFLLGAVNIYAQSKATSGDRQYTVVINHEEQYSIWLKNETAPRGWKDTKVSGSLEQCHKYIKEVWTDMRPLSIQKKYSKSDVEYGVILEPKFLGAYQIWPTSQAVPKGYQATKVKGSFSACTKYIEEVWTDMRPLSLQKRLK